MNQSQLSERLWDLSARVGKVVDALPESKLGRHVAGQLVRCGTSSAPNYDESGAAESRDDFIHKISVALKELRETRGWLRFIIKAGLLSQKKVGSVLEECEQLYRVLGKSVLTAKNGRTTVRSTDSFPIPDSRFQDSASGPKRIHAPEAFAALPPEWPHDPMPEIQRLITASRAKVVVLDDDPTGTQTVHDVPVLTEWSVESLRRELGSAGHCFFILTNSRSLPPEQARALNCLIARNLLGAASGNSFVVVSRSDSTLRGHFPLETDALSEVLGPFDGVLLVPFFETGGRHTINDVHYLAEGEWLTPVALTQFARDVTFGYRNSNLRAWVEEKSAGRIRAENVASISIEMIRRGGPKQVCQSLTGLHRGCTGVVNVASGRDLLVFVLGLLQAQAAGKRFIFRSAASFAAARAGITPRPLLTAAELFGEHALTRESNLESGAPKSETRNLASGGLVVVGSYVLTSSEQLRELLAGGRTVNVELNVRAVLADEEHSELARASAAVNAALAAGRDTVLYTSRELVTGCDGADSLAICRRVSGALMEVISRIAVRPRFMVAKGGITSSDVATGPLRVKRAVVLGQILPGVPLWRMGAEGHWPGLIYVSFPGNLGGATALRDVVDKLSGNREIGHQSS